jgi:hypothetical protein
MGLMPGMPFMPGHAGNGIERKTAQYAGFAVPAALSLRERRHNRHGTPKRLGVSTGRRPPVSAAVEDTPRPAPASRHRAWRTAPPHRAASADGHPFIGHERRHIHGRIA